MGETVEITPEAFMDTALEKMTDKRVLVYIANDHLS
jgi:hypothetical protein